MPGGTHLDNRVRSLIQHIYKECTKSCFPKYKSTTDDDIFLAFIPDSISDPDPKTFSLTSFQGCISLFSRSLLSCMHVAFCAPSPWFLTFIWLFHFKPALKRLTDQIHSLSNCTWNLILEFVSLCLCLEIPRFLTF